MGNQAWTEALEWPGATSFHAAEQKMFKVKSKSGGVYKSAEGLTFMRVPFSLLLSTNVIIGVWSWTYVPNNLIYSC